MINGIIEAIALFGMITWLLWELSANKPNFVGRLSWRPHPFLARRFGVRPTLKTRR
jgi:hypothetical protein